MVKGVEYTEIGIKKYEENLITNKMKTLNRLAKELNYEIAGNVQIT